MQSETKKCQNCQKDFIIESDDFSFYEKIKVPSPTFCPECRRMRRLAWYNVINLFHRNCNLCGEKFISMYPPDDSYIVYCPKCWWSDKWNALDYGQEYDFSKPFFEQFRELIHKVPLLGLSINSTTTVGSPYNNHAADLKDCYLTFDSDFNQECAYGVNLTRNRETFDSSMIMDSDSCYDCMNLYKSHNVIGGRGNNRSCIDCYFIRDCENCQNCFMCAGLRNKNFYFKNEKYTKKEYFKKIEFYNLDSSRGYLNAQKDAEKFWRSLPPKPSWDTMSINCTGSYIFNSKNCHECYDVSDCEDSKYLLAIYRKPQKSCYDVSSFGYAIENVYEGGVVGEYASNVLFCQESGIHLLDAEYCKLSFGGKSNFGCVSIRKKEYIIFNKKYTKEEYITLRKKIIKQMNNMPYIDKLGNIYKYGEFFPVELSPFPYNMTYAQLFNPKNKDEIEKMGSYSLKENKNKYKITKKIDDLPDSVKDIDNNILNEVIECSKCNKGYKIIEMELRFLKKMNLSIPHECPFCRINNKLSIWVDNMHLKDRICDKCNKDFKTHYSKKEAPIVYCKECYKKEIY